MRSLESSDCRRQMVRCILLRVEWRILREHRMLSSSSGSSLGWRTNKEKSICRRELRAAMKRFRGRGNGMEGDCEVP